MRARRLRQYTRRRNTMHARYGRRKTNIIPGRPRALRVAVLCALSAVAGAQLVVTDAQARVTKIVIAGKESPTFGGYSWPGVGQYEKIYGKAFGELNPNDAKNALITDL